MGGWGWISGRAPVWLWGLVMWMRESADWKRCWTLRHPNPARLSYSATNLLKTKKTPHYQTEHQNDLTSGSGGRLAFSKSIYQFFKTDSFRGFQSIQIHIQKVASCEDAKEAVKRNEQEPLDQSICQTPQGKHVLTLQEI